MAEQHEPARVLTELWDLIDQQQWDKIGDLLDPAVQVRWVHTGEVLDADDFVRVNRDYPGRWHTVIADLVSDRDRAVSRTEVTDGTQTFWVASFATVSGARITELVEVWTEAGAKPPPARSGADR